MNQIATTFAKLAGLQKVVGAQLSEPVQAFRPPNVLGCFEAYARILTTLKQLLPDLFDDLPEGRIPEPIGATDNFPGYIERDDIECLDRDIEYILEVRSHSELSVPTPSLAQERRIFISHGGSNDWREVQTFVEKDLGIPTLELAQQPNLGRTVLQKLLEESSRCSYAIVVMTGEDKTEDGQVRARENVMHEIGFFQGKFGLARVCLLHEEGTNMPSNIHGLVYIPFPPGYVGAGLGALSRELSAAFR